MVSTGASSGTWSTSSRGSAFPFWATSLVRFAGPHDPSPVPLAAGLRPCVRQVGAGRRRRQNPSWPDWLNDRTRHPYRLTSPDSAQCPVCAAEHLRPRNGTASCARTSSCIDRSTLELTTTRRMGSSWTLGQRPSRTGRSRVRSGTTHKPLRARRVGAWSGSVGDPPCRPPPQAAGVYSRCRPRQGRAPRVPSGRPGRPLRIFGGDQGIAQERPTASRPPLWAGTAADHPPVANLA